MSDTIKVQTDNIRVELENLFEHEENPDTKSEFYGVWSASISIHGKKVFAGRELDVWRNWFSMPTTLPLDTSREKVQACGEKLLGALQFLKHLLPKEENDFGPTTDPNVNSMLLSRLTDVASGKD